MALYAGQSHSPPRWQWLKPLSFKSQSALSPLLPLPSTLLLLSLSLCWKIKINKSFAASLQFAGRATTLKNISTAHNFDCVCCCHCCCDSSCCCCCCCDCCERTKFQFKRRVKIANQSLERHFECFESIRMCLYELLDWMHDWLNALNRAQSQPQPQLGQPVDNWQIVTRILTYPSPPFSLTEGTTELQNGRLIWGNHKPNWTYEQLGQLFRWTVVPPAVSAIVVFVVVVAAITIDPLGSFIVSDSIAKGSINMAAGLNVLNPLRANGAKCCTCWLLLNVPSETRWGLQIRP